ncbi:hypothetical protein [Streptomyces morookaense]|uniref:Uncharacterized protein n=1 Tax=Streptomyces morookaense TaxID=1970 RepID=A0A7Y7B716_STRMO|nr:hypothetical protein [Streptomyces morookaense]NVK80197.1 hypothetical protein [Streptomyces morookaense]GHF28913.1 hypothetical protein GCM10010359_34230 [Streptomyces morookaense]
MTAAARETAFREPLYPTRFSPLQLRPRTLLDLAVNGLARWLAEHLTPFPHLVHKHRTAIVVRTLRLDCTTPDLRFADTPWLDVRARLATTGSGEWLVLSLAYEAGGRTAARARLVLRVLAVAEPETLSAEPGALPPDLLAGFTEAERLPPDALRELARTRQPFGLGTELLAPQEWETTLSRSQCEVADQWSFIEMIELATTARERLSTTTGPALPAAHAPVRSLAAFFQRPMFVFDTCRTVTRAHHAPRGGRTVFRHDIGHAAPPRTAAAGLRVWELLDAA